MQTVIIAGFGFMGAMHAQIYSQLENATLVGVIDQRTDVVRTRLKELGFTEAKVFATVEEACAQAEFDVLDVCLPTDLHLSFALKGIAAGKAVFCEKPFALSNAEAEQIRDAAKAAGTPLQVGQCIRFWPEYQALTEFVNSGKGGKLLSFSLQRRSARPGYAEGDWLNQEARSNGAAFDLHIHDTDFVTALLGKPSAVTSQATFDATGPSHIFSHYHYEGGPIVHAEGGWNYPGGWGFQMAFQALFENAAIEYDSSASPTLTLTTATEPKAPMPFTPTGSGHSKIKEGNVSDLGGYYNELAYFIDRLEKKQPIEQATAEQAALSVRVVLSEIESARTGKTIAIA